MFVDDQVKPSPSDAKTLLKLAHLHMEAGDWEDAISACEHAIRAAPDHYLPPTVLGSIHLAQGDFRQATHTLRRVLKTNKDHALPHLYLAEVLFLSGAKRQGLRRLEKARSASDIDDSQTFLELVEELFASDRSI